MEKRGRRPSDAEESAENAGLSDDAPVVDRLTFEVALLFFRMRVAADQFLGQGELSAARRGLMKSLGAHGPQTVPQMAGARSVSRQHIQKLVNSLREDGLVCSLENPLHRRSVLIGLSPEGRRFLAEMEGREADLWSFLSDGIPDEDLHTALEVIHALRGKFESEEWERVASRRP